MASYLKELFEYGKSLLATADIETLLPKVIDLVIKETQSQRCRIILWTADGKEIENVGKVAGAVNEKNDERKVSIKIIEYVKKTNEPIHSANAMFDERFLDDDRDQNTIFLQHVMSVVCAPIREKGSDKNSGKVFGVIYIDNRSREGMFDAYTAGVLEGIADLISGALKKSLENTLKRRKEAEQLQIENRQLRNEVNRLKGFGEIVGTSVSMQKIYEKINHLKGIDVKVLITGETGTGKGLLAQTIHNESPRNDQPFVEVDCSAIPEPTLESALFGHEKGAFTGAVSTKIGYIESANGGTLFLDEIGNLSLAVQQKLLRFLDTREYARMGSTQNRKADVRLLFATNKDIDQLIRDGKFMDDLRYRIMEGVEIKLPPLKDRGEDVRFIAEKFREACCEEFNKKVHFSKDALELLLKHPLPGNARQLRQVVRNAVIWAKGEKITAADFPPEFVEHVGDSRLPGDSIIFRYPAPKEKNPYGSEAGKDFIFGMSSYFHNSEEGQVDERRIFHDKLLILSSRAARRPMKEAGEAARAALERNMIISYLEKTKGNISEAARQAGVDRKTFITKMEDHALSGGWFKE